MNADLQAVQERDPICHLGRYEHGVVEQMKQTSAGIVRALLKKDPLKLLQYASQDIQIHTPYMDGNFPMLSSALQDPSLCRFNVQHYHGSFNVIQPPVYQYHGYGTVSALNEKGEPYFTSPLDVSAAWICYFRKAYRIASLHLYYSMPHHIETSSSFAEHPLYFMDRNGLCYHEASCMILAIRQEEDLCYVDCVDRKCPLVIHLTLDEIEKELPPLFLRIDAFHLINPQHIVHFSNGFLVLTSGVEYSVDEEGKKILLKACPSLAELDDPLIPKGLLAC